MDIPAAIRANLGRMKWGLADLAKSSGIPYGTLIKKIQGKTEFKMAEIEKISTSFGITALRLFEAAEEAETLKTEARKGGRK